MNKLVKLFGTYATTNAQTIGWPSSLESLYSGYSKMDVLLNVRQISGGNVSVTIQEEFPQQTVMGTSIGTTYLTTAKINGAISSSGVYVMTYEDNNAQIGTPYGSPSTGKNFLLGKGQAKRVVVNAAGLTSMIMDIIMIFYQD